MSAGKGSVSVWIDLIKAGDRTAVDPLWQRYFARLVGLARRRLKGIPDRAEDAEDVALSALDSFCRRAEQRQGAAALVTDRDDLWALLCDIAHNKARTVWRKVLSRKRGGGKVAAAADRQERAGADDFFAEQVSGEPSPEAAALFAEEVDRLLGRLREDERAVAVLKLEGFTNEQIRQRLGVGLATVERRLQAIRRKWQDVS